MADDVPLDDDSFPMVGCSIALMVDFVEEHGGKQAFDGLTTDDVKNRFVLAATAATQQSLCQQRQASGDTRVGRPRFFVSHAWKYQFLKLLQVGRGPSSSSRLPHTCCCRRSAASSSASQMAWTPSCG